MAQRVLKNNTASPVTIADVGQTVPASGQLVINPIDYGKYEGSSDVIGFISDLAVNPTTSTLTVSDGTFDLSINEGTRLIQGGFSRPIADGDDPTIKANVIEDTGGVKRLATDGKIEFGNFEDLVAMTRSGGFQNGESFDKIVATDISATEKLLQYSKEDICQFDILIEKTGSAFTLSKNVCEGFLLQENSDVLLQENGDKLKVFGLIPL